MLPLGFGRSPVPLRRPGRRRSPTLDDLAGKRIATSYVGVVRRHLEERGIEATVIRLDGAVETSIQLGVADVIADVVETGSTLRQRRARGLRRVDPGVRGGADHPRRRRAAAGFEVFRRRLEGVLVARTYVMMDYDIPSRPGRGGRRADPRHREPDGVAAAPRGLGRGARRWCRATAPSG